MAAKKTERLLNLVICLLSTRRFLTVHQVLEAVPGYDAPDEEAVRRMFERDKDDLRDLGIPLETGKNSYDDEYEGYRIARRDYELPDLHLEPDEAAALGLAARLWQSAPLAAATGSALLKLKAAGVEPPALPAALQPRVGASEPAFAACWAAVRDGSPVRFDYRASGRPTAESRRVEPWGVVSWRGRWYLVGHDRVRQAARVFRLSRVVGAVRTDGPAGSVVVPEGQDLRAMVERMATDTPRTTARVRLRTGAGWELRREATNVEVVAAGAASTGEAGTVEASGGWDIVDVGYSDPERFADRVTGYGADAVVLSPPEARDAVVRRLQSLAGAAR